MSNNIVCFTGGTGFRFVAQELRRYRSVHVTHIQNVSDSGGSTRPLRFLFDMPAIGDLRSRLIDLADRDSPGYKEITALLNHRLATENSAVAMAEFESILSGDHALFRAVEGATCPPGFASIILGRLKQFDLMRIKAESVKGMRFDFRKGSIGNLFLTGEYFVSEHDLEAAIFMYKQLAGVRGDIVPATLDNIHLAAELEDGSRIIGQHLITHKETPSPISSLYYLDHESNDAKVMDPVVNPVALRAIRDANLIVFSMGSFFTSILSTLFIKGIAAAIHESKAEKVLIVNPTEDEETLGMTGGAMAAKLIETLRCNDPNRTRRNGAYLNRVIHHGHPGEKRLENGKQLLLHKTRYPSGVTQRVVALSTEGHYLAGQLAEIIAHLVDQFAHLDVEDRFALLSQTVL